MAKNIWTLISLVLLISANVALPLRTPEASANGGTRLIVNDEKVGPYLFRLGILPGNPKVGNLHLNVLIQAAEGDAIIEHGEVNIRATGPEPGMTAGPVQAENALLNPQLFDADITLTALGRWDISVETSSELGEATLVVPLQVTKAEGLNPLVVILSAVTIMAIVALVWSQKKQRRRTRRKQ